MDGCEILHQVDSGGFSHRVSTIKVMQDFANHPQYVEISHEGTTKTRPGQISVQEYRARILAEMAPKDSSQGSFTYVN